MSYKFQSSNFHKLHNLIRNPLFHYRVQSRGKASELPNLITKSVDDIRKKGIKFKWVLKNWIIHLLFSPQDLREMERDGCCQLHLISVHLIHHFSVHLFRPLKPTVVKISVEFTCCFRNVFFFFVIQIVVVVYWWTPFSVDVIMWGSHFLWHILFLCSKYISPLFWKNFNCFFFIWYWYNFKYNFFLFPLHPWVNISIMLHPHFYCNQLISCKCPIYFYTSKYPIPAYTFTEYSFSCLCFHWNGIHMTIRKKKTI